MNIADASFCPECTVNADIRHVIQKYVSIDDHALKRIYGRWAQSSFQRSRDPVEEDYPTTVSTALLVSSPPPNVRTDFPVYLGGGKPHAHRICLLAQDPGATYELCGRRDTVEIGTPFSIHSCRNRQRKAGVRYIQLVEALLDEGDVYITDAYKLRMEGSKRKWPCGKAVFSGVLREELKLLKPDVVVALGRTAGDMLVSRFPKFANLKTMEELCGWNCQFCDQLPVILLPHPSGLNASLASWTENFSGLSYTEILMTAVKSVLPRRDALSTQTSSRDSRLR